MNVEKRFNFFVLGGILVSLEFGFLFSTTCDENWEKYKMVRNPQVTITFIK